MWGGCCPQGANCLRRRGHAAANLRTATSSEVAPEIREFERISTTVANAYLMRLAARYVGRLAERVAGRGIRCRLLLMLSSGGLTDVEEARRFPVRMLESGPATAGAIAVAWFGARAGHDDLLAFDMGGTTARLCLVDGGESLVTHAFEACRERRLIAGSGRRRYARERAGRRPSRHCGQSSWKDRRSRSLHGQEREPSPSARAGHTTAGLEGAGSGAGDNTGAKRHRGAETPGPRRQRCGRGQPQHRQGKLNMRPTPRAVLIRCRLGLQMVI